MLDKIAHFTIVKNGNEVEYPLAFTFNVLEEIQEKYGTFNAWQDKLEPEDGELKFKDLKFTFRIMVNEGIDIENEEKSENRPFVSDKQIGRILTDVGIQNIAEQLKDVVSSSISSKN